MQAICSKIAKIEIVATVWPQYTRNSYSDMGMKGFYIGIILPTLCNIIWDFTT